MADAHKPLSKERLAEIRQTIDILLHQPRSSTEFLAAELLAEVDRQAACIEQLQQLHAHQQSAIQSVIITLDGRTLTRQAITLDGRTLTRQVIKYMHDTDECVTELQIE